jgi:phosphoglycolate phosphatase-like HAD superfamily hydrolase
MADGLRFRDKIITTLVIDFFGTLCRCSVDIPAAIRPVLLANLTLTARHDMGWPNDVEAWSATRGWPDVWQPYDPLRIADYRGHLTGPQLWNAYIEAFLGRMGRSYESTFCIGRTELVTKLQLAEISVYADAELMSGAEKFLTWARSAGCRLVLCSNAGLQGWETIRRLLPIPGPFDTKDLAVSYLLGEHKLGHLDGEMSLFVALIYSTGIDPASSLVIEDEVQYMHVAANIGYEAVLQVSPVAGFPTLSALQWFLETCG